MKKNFSLLVWMGVLLLGACEKDDTIISMNQSELAGTYWREVSVDKWRFVNGEWVSGRTDTFDGSLTGGPGPRTLFFPDGKTIVFYLSLGDNWHLKINYAFMKRDYGYFPEQRRFVVYAKASSPESNYGLVTFTPEKLVWEKEGSKDRYRHTFVRYDPTEERLQRFAEYPDYDEIDWPF